MTVAPAFFLAIASVCSSPEQAVPCGRLFFVGRRRHFRQAIPPNSSAVAAAIARAVTLFHRCILSCGSNSCGFPDGYARPCRRLRRQIQIQLADRRWQMYVNE
jgi:hypothetical protein